MAKRRSKKQEEEILVDVSEIGQDVQSFYEKNEKFILGGIIAILLVGVGFFAYQNFYKKPREKTAQSELYYAERQFDKDSLESAVANPGGGHLGFAEIASKYKGTKAANAANYYCAVSYLKLGKYDAALSYIKDFEAKGKLAPILKHGVMGDIFSEQELYDKAIGAYQKAVNAGDNNFLTPHYLKKLGLLYETQGKTDKAVEAYETIKTTYKKSQEGYNIDKYINHVEIDF